MRIKTITKLLVGLATALTLPFTAFAAYLYLTQERIIFPATALPGEHSFDFDVPFREITIPVEGADINGLHFKQPDPRGLVFFLHGNGGNLESWTTNVDYYRRVNYDMFIFDYRGYGKSTGQIESEAQLHADVRTAWNAIVSQYREKPIVIYGRSLGTALAANLAADVNPDLLILVSPFSSMVAMAQRQYPFLPSWLVRYPLRTDELVADIQSPMILMHGAEDSFIPVSHSYELRDLASANTKLLIIEGANHNNIHEFKSYLDGLAMALPD